MTITVAKLKRALEEAHMLLPDSQSFNRSAMFQIAQSPTALTVLAEKLSERPARVTPEAQARPFRLRNAERPDWGNPGARVEYVCSTNPLRHKGGEILRINEHGLPVIQWDNWASPTSVTWGMIEQEHDSGMPLDGETDDDYQRRVSGT